MFADRLAVWLRRLADRLSPSPSAARAGAQVAFNMNTDPEEMFRRYQREQNRKYRQHHFGQP